MYELDNELAELFQTALTEGELSEDDAQNIIVILEAMMMFQEPIEC